MSFFKKLLEDLSYDYININSSFERKIESGFQLSHLEENLDFKMSKYLNKDDLGPEYIFAKNWKEKKSLIKFLKTKKNFPFLRFYTISVIFGLAALPLIPTLINGYENFKKHTNIYEKIFFFGLCFPVLIFGSLLILHVLYNEGKDHQKINQQKEQYMNDLIDSLCEIIDDINQIINPQNNDKDDKKQNNDRYDKKTLRDSLEKILYFLEKSWMAQVGYYDAKHHKEISCSLLNLIVNKENTNTVYNNFPYKGMLTELKNKLDEGRKDTNEKPSNFLRLINEIDHINFNMEVKQVKSIEIIRKIQIIKN
jgi:hypothetical protein